MATLAPGGGDGAWVTGGFAGVVGAIVTGVWTWLTLAGVEWAASLHPILPGLATAGIIMLVVTWFTPPVREGAILKFFPERD